MHRDTFKILILSGFLLILPCKTTQACECVSILIDLPVKEMGWTQTETKGISSISDVIFTGILIDSKQVEESYQSLFFYEEKENMVELTFKLLKSYKGDKADIMKIRTNFGDAACGFGAQMNTVCLIFAAREKGGYYY
ncbi:hypothetical protein, partial [Runella sp.]|uniref:hypothetical protein n=1 Tax=Runella sp. TaxID=1960881 RepID=UPI003019C6EE